MQSTGQDDEAVGGARIRGGRSWSDRLPSGRAVLGSALVVVSAAGVLAVHRAATRPATTRFVVAAHEIQAGAVLTARDLGTMAMDLPSGVSAVPSGRATSLVGAVARHRLGRLDLLRPGDVAKDGDAPKAGSVEVPVEVDRERSLGSSLQVGSRVDVLSTDPDGVGTTVLARGVLVTEVGRRDEGIGSSGGIGVHLALEDVTTVASVVDASVRSQLTLVLPRPGGSDG